MKRQATDGEKYVQVIYLTKNLYLECVKSAENSSRKSVILAQMGKKKKNWKKTTSLKKIHRWLRTSLVVQWLGTHLLM